MVGGSCLAVERQSLAMPKSKKTTPLQQDHKRSGDQERKSVSNAEGVRSWLTRQGFPLEMEVASAFASEKFDVFQSEIYEDPEEKKEREIDVVAGETVTVDERMLIEVRFVVECKLSANAWVLFSSEQRSAVARTRSLSRLFVSSIRSPELIKALCDGVDENDPVASIPRRIGYGLREAHTSGSGRDDCLKACGSVAGYSAATNSMRYDSKPGPYWLDSIIVPIVVLDGPFFECWLGESAQLRIEPLTHGVIHWKRQTGSMRDIYIRVCHVRELDKLVRSCRQFVERLLLSGGKAIKSEVDAREAWETFRKSRTAPESPLRNV